MYRVLLEKMVFLVLLWAISATTVCAEDVQPSQVPDNKELPLWEAGILAGGISQPAYPGAVERVNLALALPYLIYRGEYLRVDRDNFGVRAIRTQKTEVDVGFAASLGSRAEDVEARRGMDDLGTLVEFGPRLKVYLGEQQGDRRGSRIQIPVRGVFDLNDHFRYRGMAYELQWVHEMRPHEHWEFTTNLAAIYGDQQLAETFYRVTPAEATSSRPAYEAKAGLIALRGSLFATRLYGPDLRVVGYVRVDSVAQGVNHDSPLVQRDSGWTVGLGLAWGLAYSEQVARQ